MKVAIATVAVALAVVVLTGLSVAGPRTVDVITNDIYEGCTSEFAEDPAVRTVPRWREFCLRTERTNVLERIRIAVTGDDVP
jgi:hypothetical protein